MIKKLLKTCNIQTKTLIIRLLKCFLLMCVYTLISLLFPGFIGKIVDIIMGEPIKQDIIFYIILMCITGALMIVFYYLQGICIYTFSQEIIVNLKNKIYEKILLSNLKFHSFHKNGDIFTIIQSDVAVLEQLFTTVIKDVIINILMIAGILCYILKTDLLLGMIVAILSMVFVVIQKKLGIEVEQRMTSLRSCVGEFSAFINETINNLVTIQLLGVEDRVSKRFHEKNKKVFDKFIQQMRFILYSGLWAIGFSVIGMLAVLGIGSLRVYSNLISIGTLINLVIYTQKIYSPVVMLGNAYVTLKNANPSIKKILDIMDDKNVLEDGEYYPAYNLHGEIVLKNVYFSYGQKEVFHNLNLYIAPHQVIGIVGKNGSGKSTLIYLLAKLCKVDRGEILLDGHNISEYSIDYLRQQIGIMPQKTFILSGTIRDIVMPSGKNITDEEIIKWLEIFGFETTRLDKGIDTVISENLLNISGGEAQKLALVRLFLENKSIYILDEPTSALDMNAEHEICELIQNYFCNSTMIIITHREEIKKICTQIVVFDETSKKYS